MVTINALSTVNPSPMLTGTIDDPAAVIRITLNGASFNAINNGNGTSNYAGRNHQADSNRWNL